MGNTIYVIMMRGSLQFAGYVTSEGEAREFCNNHDDFFYFPANKIKLNTCPHCGYKFEFGTRVGHWVIMDEETGEAYFDYKKVCPRCEKEYPNDVNYDYKTNKRKT